MMLNTWQKQEKLKRRFTLPNELFSLELNSAEISIYAYLLYCEDRKTHQCWPSYKKIAKEVGLSPKTVRKYIIISANLLCKVVESKKSQEKMPWLTASLGGLPRWLRAKMEVNHE